MINGSKARLTLPDTNSNIAKENLHELLSINHFRRTRLFLCSCLTLFFSILLWILDTHIGIHALILAICFGLPWSFPGRKHFHWGLAKVTEQTGLSYATALEYQNRSDDSYGLLEELRIRRAEIARNFKIPEYTPWWIPLLILSGGFLFMPSLEGHTQRFIAPTDTVRDVLPSDDINVKERNSDLLVNTQTAGQIEEYLLQRNRPGQLDTSTTALTNPEELWKDRADENILADFVTNLPNQNIASGLTEAKQNQSTPLPSTNTPPLSEVSKDPQETPGTTNQGSSDHPGAKTSHQSELLSNETEEMSTGTSTLETPATTESSSPENGALSSRHESFGEYENDGTPRTPDLLGIENTAPPQLPGSLQQSKVPDTVASNGPMQGDQTGTGSTPGENRGEFTNPQRPNPQRLPESSYNPEFIDGVLSDASTHGARTTELFGEKNSITFPEGLQAAYDQIAQNPITDGRIPVDYQKIIRAYFR